MKERYPKSSRERKHLALMRLVVSKTRMGKCSKPPTRSTQEPPGNRMSQPGSSAPRCRVPGHFQRPRALHNCRTFFLTQHEVQRLRTWQSSFESGIDAKTTIRSPEADYKENVLTMLARSIPVTMLCRIPLALELNNHKPNYPHHGPRAQLSAHAHVWQG